MCIRDRRDERTRLHRPRVARQRRCRTIDRVEHVFARRHSPRTHCQQRALVSNCWLLDLNLAGPQRAFGSVVGSLSFAALHVTGATARDLGERDEIVADHLRHLGCKTVLVMASGYGDFRIIADMHVASFAAFDANFKDLRQGHLYEIDERSRLLSIVLRNH